MGQKQLEVYKTGRYFAIEMNNILSLFFYKIDSDAFQHRAKGQGQNITLSSLQDVVPLLNREEGNHLPQLLPELKS